jgi:hypothetical protein
MRLVDLESNTVPLSPPRAFDDPLSGKSRLVMVRLNPLLGVAYQIDLANQEWRSQKMGIGGAGFSPWVPLEPEPAGARVWVI